MDEQKAIAELKKIIAAGAGDETVRAVGMACVALRRQEPMEPVKSEFGFERCPVCGRYVRTAVYDMLDYCSNCGQRIRWHE